MAKSMTLEEVKKKKMKLELDVVKMFKEFELGTELKISYIDVMRKQLKDKKSTGGFNKSYEPHKGKIMDININVDLDLVY